MKTPQSEKEFAPVTQDGSARLPQPNLVKHPTLLLYVGMLFGAITIGNIVERGLDGLMAKPAAADLLLVFKAYTNEVWRRAAMYADWMSFDTVWHMLAHRGDCPRPSSRSEDDAGTSMDRVWVWLTKRAIETCCYELYRERLDADEQKNAPPAEGEDEGPCPHCAFPACPGRPKTRG